VAVLDGTVYTGSPGAGLRALDAVTGETRWQTDLVGGYPGPPTAVGDRVYTTGARRVYALGAGSGRELWSTTVESQVSTSALVVGDGTGDDARAGGEGSDRTVVVGAVDQDGDGSDGAGTDGQVARVYAFHGGGAKRWTTRLESGTLYGGLAARGDLVYGGGSTGQFYALDVATGDVRWRTALGDHATSPAVGERSVLVGDETGTLHARNRWTGGERWHYDVGAEVRTSPAVADGTVYVAARDGHLHAVDAETGTRRWRFDGGRRLTAAPTVAGDASDEDGAAVYVGSQQGTVFSVDAGTGDVRWSHQLPDAVETAPVVVDGVVVVGDGEGRVHELVAAASLPDGAPGACRTATPTSTPGTDRSDTDGDGVVDANDYAPRDRSVQRRSDLTERRSDDGPGFVSGVGVGAVVSAFGGGVGWWLASRGRGGPDDD
jgi:outer membrane protein assembly factor BamB